MPGAVSCFGVVGGNNTYVDLWKVSVTPGQALHASFVTSGYQALASILDPINGVVLASSPCPFGASTSCSFDYSSLGSTYYVAVGGVNPSGNYTLTVSAGSSSPSQVNLAPYQPSGWSDKIVVSTVPGTTTDAAQILPSSTLYVDYAVANLGTASSVIGFTNLLYLDGVLVRTGNASAVDVGFYSYASDFVIAPLTAGVHTLRLVADSTNVVGEINESDNSYTKTFSVGGGSSGVCSASSTALCLAASRFRVSVAWSSAQASPSSGSGMATSMTSDTGTFWFFSSSNVELVIKVLDATPINGRFWVFYGALSNVQYRITVTDTLRGITKTYTNPEGTLASVADTNAFTP